MKMLRILAVLALFSTSFAACKKDDAQPQPTKTEMLSGKWKLTALTASPTYKSVTDVFATYPACFKDDFQTFAASGTYTYDEGATKCDPASTQTETGTWKFNTSETQLTLTLPTYSDIWEISGISASALTSVYKLTENGVTYTFTGTLQKV